MVLGATFEDALWDRLETEESSRMSGRPASVADLPPEHFTPASARPSTYTRSIFSSGSFVRTSRPRSTGADLRRQADFLSMPGFGPIEKQQRLSILRVGSAGCGQTHGRGFGRYGSTPGNAWGQFAPAPERPVVSLLSHDGRARLLSHKHRAPSAGGSKLKPWQDL
eukprot:TRINITY_DN86038_c0_g1_i1.p1 TRINITY_DN86038_c0_g1~~TRINITY_DN86038_c0_g1_i1.p1  ORF type:complete len:173 (+),score=22.33 TRINITY_DN86038_c0_g1_i1:23-520(+)